MIRWVISRGLVIALMLVGFGSIGSLAVVQPAAAACPNVKAGDFPSAPYSNSELECMLRNGQQTAIDWDYCRYDAFKPNAALFGGNIRDMINGYSATKDSPYGGCGYSSSTWLSGYNTPNAQFPIKVAYGTKTVPLQINYVKFINGPLVVTDYGGDGGWSKIFNNNSRWANAANGGNDRAPNSINTWGQKPAHIGSHTYINKLVAYSVPTNVKCSSATASQKTYSGYSMSSGTGVELAGNRLNNTRYWFAKNPSATNLKISGAGITTTSRICVEMTYQRADAVYKGDPTLGDIMTWCSYGPNYAGRYPLWGSAARYDNITKCEKRVTTLQIDLNVPLPYTLTPALTLNPSSSAQPGTTINTQPSVSSTNPAGTHDWRVSVAVYNPGTNPNFVTPTDNDVCDAFKSEASCTADFSSSSTVMGKGVTNLTQKAYTVAAGAAIGSKVCFVTSVSQPNQSASTDDWAYSAMQCVVIASRPTVQIWGNDVRVGSALAVTGVLPSTIGGSVIGSGGLYYGAWGEYSALAPGSISNFATGSAFVNGNASAAQSGWSKLTFANKATYGNLAPAASLGVLPDVGAYFAKSTESAITKVSGGNMTISAYAPNTVYVSSGTVTIDGDIIGQTGVASGEAITQMVIIAANGIRISESVGQVDAWLVSPNGVIDTCYQKSGALTVGDCNKLLTIHGPTIASRLLLKRTSGDKTTPAEILNLRGDSYAWAKARSEGNGSYQTKHTTDLPPRY